MFTIQPHVLVGVTGDHDMDAALTHAATEALGRGCGVHLVHVQHDLYPGSPEVAELRIVDGELRKASLDLLERAEKHVQEFVGDSVPVSTELMHGLVVPSLVSCSEDACLVVLQRRPHGHLTRLSALSVTSGVAARAHPPVVVVPSAWHVPEGDSAPVVVGVEDVTTASNLVSLGLDEARRLGAGVRLVQCWWISQLYDDIVFGDRTGPDHTARLHRSLVADFGSLREEYADVPVEVVVTHAPPADTLVHEAQRARLLVVGRHQPAVPFGSHLGPITRTVLRESTCPVLVAKLD